MIKKGSRVRPCIEIIVGVRSAIPKKALSQTCHKLFDHFYNHRILRQRRSIVSGQSDLTIVFVGKQKARSLNRAYRGRDYATDVLSFSPETQGVGLGELVFCEPVLRRQAQEHGLSLKQEVIYLTIHGFLHLLGYDHETKRQEKRMMVIQDRLFNKLAF